MGQIAINAGEDGGAIVDVVRRAQRAVENDVNVGYNEEYQPLGCAGP